MSSRLFLFALFLQKDSPLRRLLPEGMKPIFFLTFKEFLYLPFSFRLAALPFALTAGSSLKPNSSRWSAPSFYQGTSV